MLLALVALAVQSLAVQTHVHMFAPAALAGLEHGERATESVHATASHESSACVFCQAITSGGALLAPTESLDESAATFSTASLRIRPAPRALTHSWQSRAPPISL